MLQNPDVYISILSFVLISRISREILIDPTEFAIGTEDIPDGFLVTLAQHAKSSVSRKSRVWCKYSYARPRER